VLSQAHYLGGLCKHQFVNQQTSARVKFVRLFLYYAMAVVYLLADRRAISPSLEMARHSADVESPSNHM
jgi:hypothetical protein